MDRVILPDKLQQLLPPELHDACVGNHYPKGNCLFRVGHTPHHMFYVVSGEVTLERVGLHGDIVVLQRTRGGFVSEASLNVSSYHCDAMVTSATVALSIPIIEMQKTLARDNNFASRWITMINDEVRRLRTQCERLRIKSVKDRLLHLILTEGIDGQYSVPSGLKTLAGDLGVSHEALYRTIADLQKKNQLLKVQDKLIIPKSP